MILNKITPIALTLMMTSCTVTPLANNSNENDDQRIVVTTDKSEWNGSFKNDLEKALKNKLGLLNEKTNVNNFTHMTTERKSVDGEAWVFMNFYTQDDKMYRTRIEANKIKNDEILKLQNLKSATLIGVIPIKNRTNEYFFQAFENLKF